MDISKSINLSKDILNFFDDAPEVNFYVIDKNKNYIYKNKALCKIIGDSDKAANTDAWEWSQRVIETGVTITVEEEHNGTFYLSKKSPLIIDGKIEGIVGISTDITDLKRKGLLKIDNALEKQEDIVHSSKRFVSKRLVKWSEGAQQFFDNAQDKSVTLDVWISHSCKSQTGEGFEDLVNSINSEGIKRKINKVRILDSSYLYRHYIPSFHSVLSPNISSVWFLNNEDTIKQIQVETEIISWSTLANSVGCEDWYKRIMIDFQGDQNGKGIVESFRDTVIKEAKEHILKCNGSSGTYEESIRFILEEKAVFCAFYKNTTVIYPMLFKKSTLDIIERYNLNIQQLPYKISQYSQEVQKRKRCSTEIQKEILAFLSDALDANFYVIDKNGDYIYKNKALSGIIGDFNSRVVFPEAWKISKEIMKLKKQMTVEEQHLDKHYLSVKSPLLINNKAEGVMGVSIDITDRKRAERLEIENKLQQLRLKDQEEFKEFVEKISHDIKSPLRSLEEFKDECRNLSVKEHAILRDINEKIQTLAGAILSRREKSLKTTFDSKDRDILVPLLLEESILQKKYEYKGKNIEFEYSFNQKDKFIFIRGNQIDFSSMISNLINNAVEAFEKDSGKVEITLSADDKTVEIGINDTGIGMPQEIVEKLMKGETVSTTKKAGQGIGTVQIRDTLKAFNGTQFIESTSNVGTKITLTFPRSGIPHWFANKITLRKGNIVVILDDDESIHQKWKVMLKDYSNDLKLEFFTKGQETANFINFSFEKNNIFFISDYDLREKYTGLVRVMETQKQNQSLIMTSISNNWKVQDAIEEARVQMIPKQFLKDIQIIVE